MGLTAKQKAFVDSYLAQGNKVDAAIYAGYPAKDALVISCQLLKNPKIITKLTELKAKIAEKQLSPELKDAKAFSKDDFINYALEDYKQLEVVEPNKPRFLHLAGQAAGFIGVNQDGNRANQTLNLTQINISGTESQPTLWEMTRKLLGNE